MKFSDPNQIGEMRRPEGLKNPHGIGDIETSENINQMIEQLLPTIKELVSEDELTVEMKRCLEKIRVFCDELTKDFKQTFLSLLDQYRNDRRQISQQIVDYLLEKNFVLPYFTIASREQAEALLKEYGLGGKFNKQNLLLVFQLPKPLARFWWKGGADSWGKSAEDIKDTAIEWGHFYRELMYVVWETQGFHENESGLRFQRVNSVGEHDPKKYYYIWEMSEWEN